MCFVALRFRFMLYSSPPLIKPLPSKATPLIRTDFRCIITVKYCYIVPLSRAITLIRLLYHYISGDHYI